VANDLSDRIWWTRQCRIQAEKRLLANHKWSQYLLFWYSFFSVVLSVVILKFDFLEDYGDVLFVCFSVFTFAISLFLASSRFSQRADELKTNYTKLQALYEPISRLEKADDSNSSQYQELTKDYTALLDGVENHLDIDDASALVDAWFRTPKLKRLKNLSRHPQSIHCLRLVKGASGRIIFRMISFSIPVVIVLATYWAETQ